ncbi:FAD-binding oxidoreductase [Halorussus halophilus]|uniref:FAD-binding oxidoreductase n=1 Tax=Halorussus halophilus TaxID=2650975 RepID=UPI001300CB7E|nr:FAD-binding oxidoreductase [Halorussus halophilus]
MTTNELPADALSTLESTFRGQIVVPGDESYHDERRVWNGMINKYPAAITRCDDVADVLAVVNVASDHDLPLSVRGGGHGVAGNALVDGGLVVDLSEMDDVRVDPEGRTARVGGGATWGDVDRQTQQFGLAAPGGVVSETGVAGLTLGGGMGHLRRKYGLSCDNLVSADVVTADGRLVVASEDRNEDLYWALRGGGGNFGVVTSFEFDLHPVGPEIESLFVWYHGDEARAVFEQFREWGPDAPRDVSVLPFYAWVPEIEEFPEEHWGEPAVAILGCYAGDSSAVESAEGEPFGPLKTIADPIADLSSPMPYVELQQMLDVDYPDGRNYYWKSVYVDELTDELIDRILDHAAGCPSKLSTIDVWQGGGAITDLSQEDAAFPYRDASFGLNYEANWDDPRMTAEIVEWVRESVEDVRKLDVVRGQYVNFAGLGEDAASVAYGDSYSRLAQVKERYDPENVFRGHQNVRPE